MTYYGDPEEDRIIRELKTRDLTRKKARDAEEDSYGKLGRNLGRAYAEEKEKEVLGYAVDYDKDTGWATVKFDPEAIASVSGVSYNVTADGTPYYNIPWTEKEEEPMKEKGILVVTTDLIENRLHLKNGIKVKSVVQTDKDKARDTISLILEGEGLEVTSEGSVPNEVDWHKVSEKIDEYGTPRHSKPECKVWFDNNQMRTTIVMWKGNKKMALSKEDGSWIALREAQEYPHECIFIREMGR
jgi:hypothetical protein